MIIRKSIVLRTVGFALALLMLLSCASAGWTASAAGGQDYTLTIRQDYGLWIPAEGRYTPYAQAVCAQKIVVGTTGTRIGLDQYAYVSQYYHGFNIGWKLLNGGTGSVISGSEYQFGTTNDTVVPMSHPANDFGVMLSRGGGWWTDASACNPYGNRYMFYDPDYSIMIDVNGTPQIAYRLPGAADIARTDYTFAGWTIEAGGSGTVIQQRNLWYYVFSTTPSNTSPCARLTAQWSVKQCTLSLQNVPYWTAGTQWAQNGGTITVNAGSSITLPTAADVEHPGCHFIGWYRDNSLHGIVTPSGSPITTITLHDDTALCAGWARNTYSLTMDMNGGYQEMSAPAYFKDGTPRYVIQGYDTDGNPIFQTNPATGSPVQATTVVPDYTPIVLTGLYAYPSDDYTGVIRNGEIVRAGYTLTGWLPSTGSPIGRFYTDANGLEAYFFGDADETLIAQWTPIDYTLTFDPDGGDPVSSMTYNIESTDVLPGAHRSGYRFLGWKAIPNNSNNYDFWEAKNIMGKTFCWDTEMLYPAGTALTGRRTNLTLQAQWEENTPPQDQISVTIGDQIGVNLLLDLDARNAETVTVTYKDLNGVEQRETFTDFSSLPQVEGGLYKIAVQIAPAQIADTVTVYIDGETLDASVKDYCNTLVAGGYDQTVVDLAQAVLDYGQAANNFFNYTDETISAVAAVSADDAKSWTPQLSDTTGKIRNVSFMALTKPEFRFYTQGVTEAEAAAYNAAGVSAAYANPNVTDTLCARFVKNINGSILIEVTGVMAERMDETIVITVPGLGTITFSGNDFAKLMADNAATEALGAALYAYGAAAKACFCVPTVDDGMEVEIG